MDKRIESFITEQKNLTLCTCIDNQPNCANVFYAYDSVGNILVLKSAKKTKHIATALLNSQVAGTIVRDIHKPGTIKGIQFTGNFILPTEAQMKNATRTYYKKHPFALAMTGEIWVIELMSIKMTDNTLGFGKKIFWNKFLPFYE